MVTNSMDALGVAVLIVFIGIYLIISTEKINRTALSLMGMGIVAIVLWAGLALGFPDGRTFSEMAEHIPWATVIFVMAMMVIVGVAGESGMFQYLALRLSAPSAGDRRRLFITFILFVWGISLMFDTTSTMLIMAPLTIEVCKALEIDFKPYLICEALTCNFASIPSIVGAVPNLVIAQETQMDPGILFLIFMPLSAILLVVTLPIMLRWYKSNTSGTAEPHRVEMLHEIDPQHMIKSRRDFYAAVIAIFCLVAGFAIGPGFGFEPALVALVVAAALLILAHDRVAQFLRDVGWDTIFFLVGLFGLVAALEFTHFIEELGDGIGVIIADNAVLAIVFLTWIPAMLSAFLDNLPVSAVLAPIATQFMTLSPILPFALIFAVNIGGYLFTPLGSPANMVAMGYAEKEHNRIPFIEFAKIGTVLGLIHLAIGSGWLLMLLFFFG